MRSIYWLLGLWLAPMIFFAQEAEKPDLPPAQMGVRLNWGFEFISENTINGQSFALLETGQHLGFGGFLNIFAEKNVQFSPFIGATYVFFPKSNSYARGCDLDSFPTYISLTDSLPGRDHRLWNITVEPSFKFYVSKLKIHIRVFPALHYNIRSKVENYSNSCGVEIPRGWVDYEDTELREMSNIQVNVGASIVKEVPLNAKSFLWLETGYKGGLSPLFRIRDPDPDREGYTLYPSGWFVNLGFFR